jgi:hypothetical protein
VGEEASEVHGAGVTGSEAAVAVGAAAVNGPRCAEATAKEDARNNVTARTAQTWRRTLGRVILLGMKEVVGS